MQLAFCCQFPLAKQAASLPLMQWPFLKYVLLNWVILNKIMFYIFLYIKFECAKYKSKPSIKKILGLSQDKNVKIMY